ncbi:hypothetical protein LR48_Vigan07g097400 [Vigna angularis]|uniref:Exocyst subunit Exo70 family protein n=1 Tax=Phaseolus angularis TaxID=3914 RepID=A0A0L9UWM9_PHAAN|nr:exocyst complex component EXO70B1-like [Vigna angularis]KOM47270.1 hypothetical protein LR48_Vigan07g097400 [Vigna angularis]
MTSVYSYFVGTKVKGKPDVYSVVSNAAFAIMSLGLSTFSPFGFKVDLMYFFCGVLIVQLMKIKLWLIIVGGCFSYSLNILHSTLDTDQRSYDLLSITIDPRSQSQSQVSTGSVSPPDSPRVHVPVPPQADPIPLGSPLQRGNSRRVLARRDFMSHIEELEKENEKVINTILKLVGGYLKANVVNEDQIAVPEIQADDNLVKDMLPSDLIDKLRYTGKLMFQNECRSLYSSCRRLFLKECLSKLGLEIEELNVEDFDKMEKIGSLIKALNITVRILFPNERILCAHVFPESYNADISFAEVCTELSISLLRFVNTLATENHQWSYHLVHVIPNVFKTLIDLIPMFDSLFYGQLFSESLRNGAILVGKRLGVFVELESLIHREVAKETVPNGGIHPTTHRVMDYLREVFTDDETFPIRRGISSFSDQVARIIKVLDTNLEAKSKSYTDPALGHVFMINNLMFLQFGEDYIYGEILGQGWYKSKINQHIELYQRSSWDKILELLKVSSRELLAESMKKKLKLFNQQFNEICKAQSEWLIFDDELREVVVKSVENTLLPTYGTFIGMIHDVVGKDAYKFIRYGIQNIQDRFSHLFSLKIA